MTVFDFIEIGTANFDTLIQDADDASFGISVEPIQEYLDDLPHRANCQRLNAAVSNYRGEIDVYYIDHKTIARLNLPAWIGGCNSVNAYHPTVLGLLQMLNLDPAEIVTRKAVQVVTFEDIVKKFNVQSCKLLKIDTEGHDATILKDYLAYCDSAQNFVADQIEFESNTLSNEEEIRFVIEQLQTRGYEVISTGHDTVMKKTMCSSC